MPKKGPQDARGPMHPYSPPLSDSEPDPVVFDPEQDTTPTCW